MPIACKSWPTKASSQTNVWTFYAWRRVTPISTSRWVTVTVESFIAVQTFHRTCVRKNLKITYSSVTSTYRLAVQRKDFPMSFESRQIRLEGKGGTSYDEDSNITVCADAIQ